jgi:hypothetical protein
MSDPRELASYATKSYRYLRLAIVVVVLSLMVSVVIERINASCWEESISAYYYTPVHTMFVGTLLALGVSIIAIRGSTDIEDMLLNVAGVLAPIVAFVPTSLPTNSCSSTAYVAGDNSPYINNNLLAFAIGGGAAVVTAIALTFRASRANARKESGSLSVDPLTAIGLLLGVALVVGGLVWYIFFRDSFLDHAHGGGAVVMFLILGIVVLISAFGAEPPFKWVYFSVAAAMALSAVGVVVAQIIRQGDWRHQILWLEILELTPFVVYWAAQTVEHWSGGVPTGEDRKARAEAAHLPTPKQANMASV